MSRLGARLVGGGLKGALIAGGVGAALGLALGGGIDALRSHSHGAFAFSMMGVYAVICAAFGLPAGAIRASLPAPRRRRFDRCSLQGVLGCGALGALIGAWTGYPSHGYHDWATALARALQASAFALLLGALSGAVLGALAATGSGGSQRLRKVRTAQEALDPQPGLSRLDAALCLIYASALAWAPLALVFGTDLHGLALDLVLAISPFSVGRGQLGLMLAGSVTLATFLALAGRAQRSPPRRFLPDRHKVFVALAGLFSGLVWLPFGAVMVASF